MSHGKAGRLALVSFVVLSAVGCTTLPVPEGADDTVFVLPVERISNTGGRSTFGYYEIHVENVADPQHNAMLKVYAGSEMEIVTGLPPGDYRITKFQFRYKESGSPGTSGDINAPFRLEPGAITVSPTTIYVRLFKQDPDSSKNWMQIRWDGTRTPTRARVLGALREEEAFPQWRVVG